jgi:hypothetical protein
LEIPIEAAMITVLADHNIEGQALLLWGTLGAAGWLELVQMRLVRFAEVGLAHDSTDRAVWRFAQANQMYLLTDNRNMEADDSLEQTIRDENTERSLPVLTIGRVDRMTEHSYRDTCAARLLDIVLYPEDYVGAGRLFIP